VRLLHPRRHGAHAAHVHRGVRHELGGHRRHLVIVSTHRRGEGVSTAHTHSHTPAAVQTGPEEVRHPRPLLLGLGGQLPVPGLDPVLLHGQGPLPQFNIEVANN